MQSLAGVRSVLPLIGGHTLQTLESSDFRRPLAKQLSLGLVVNGKLPPGHRSWGKGPLNPGDVLLLSRPIGTGVLFAASQLGLAEPQLISAALDLMQQSQEPLVEVLLSYGCTACTDVTGFGLLGHLNEMLAASVDVSVELKADQVPVMQGAMDLLAQGVSSSLSLDNAGALLAWPQLEGVMAELLIDPQTCGPLLAAIPSANSEACLKAMREKGFMSAKQIGIVVPSSQFARLSFDSSLF